MTMKPLRESMTKISPINSPWTVRVWRQEPLEGTPRNIDIMEAAINSCCANGTTPAIIAGELLKWPRVNAVEVLDPSGQGEVWYADWP